MDSLDGFRIGDYVIANFAEFDTFDNRTFKITGFKNNAFGRVIVLVVDIDRPDTGTSFYPHELSWEDGSRPTV